MTDRLTGRTVLSGPDGLVSFGEGDVLPAWARGLVGGHLLSTDIEEAAAHEPVARNETVPAQEPTPSPRPRARKAG